MMLVVIAVLTAAAGPFRLDPQQGMAQVEPHADFLRDPTGHWTLADIEARAASFQPVSNLLPDPTASAFGPSTIWYRLQPRATEPGPWYVEVSPEVDRVELILRDGGQITRRQFGFDVPFDRRAIPLTGNTVRIPDAALRGGTLYLRAVTREDMIFRMSIRPAEWEATAGRASDASLEVRRVLLIGVVGGLGLYHAFLALALREAIYVRYMAAMLSFSLYVAADSEIAWRALWPGLSLPYDPTVDVLYLVYLFLTVGFARHFLDPGRADRRLWRAAWIVYGLVAVFLGIDALAPNAVDRIDAAPFIDSALSSALFALMLAGAVRPFRRGRVGVVAYAVALLGSSIGITVENLANDLVIAETPITESAADTGVAWEAMFMALAVGERVRRLRGDRDRLAHLASRDGLTGVWNRREFDARLSEEWRRAAPGALEIGVVMFDVDHFKLFNDGNGHQAGDQVLIKVAAAAESALRRTDAFLARYGGEEFAVVLPRARPDQAEQTAERIRAAVEALALPHDASPHRRVTVSLGVAVRQAGMSIPAMLIGAADAALYEAKLAGRNRVVLDAGEVPDLRPTASPAPLVIELS